MITPLRKVNSDEKKHQSKQNQSDTSRKVFAQVLDEACEKEESKQKNIHIFTSGYTRNALPYYNFINMREYC